MPSRPRAPLATYVYCLVRNATQPSLHRVPRGVPAASRPRLLEAGPSTWLVVADVPRSTYAQAALARGLRDLDWVARCAVAHEAVVERFIGAHALVPMRLFTIFSNDSRALADLQRTPRHLDRILTRVAGSLEWGVRLGGDRTRRSRAKGRPARRHSGMAYLREKQRQLAERTADRREAERLTKEVYRAARRQAAQIKQHEVAIGADNAFTVLIDLACLVPVAHTAKFRRAMRTLALQGRRAGFRLIVTGPWPPYNFIGEIS